MNKELLENMDFCKQIENQVKNTNFSLASISGRTKVTLTYKNKIGFIISHNNIQFKDLYSIKDSVLVDLMLSREEITLLLNIQSMLETYEGV